MSKIHHYIIIYYTIETEKKKKVLLRNLLEVHGKGLLEPTTINLMTQMHLLYSSLDRDDRQANMKRKYLHILKLPGTNDQHNIQTFAVSFYETRFNQRPVIQTQ